MQKWIINFFLCKGVISILGWKELATLNFAIYIYEVACYLVLYFFSLWIFEEGDPD